MSRPSRVQTYMECAFAFAKRATCHRLNVGAVIVVDRTIVAHGYNGVPPGQPHCIGNDCPGKLECRLTVHAEENALNRVPASARFLRKDLYTTDSPCPKCAELLMRAGVSRVFFTQPYRITTALDTLVENGVEVYRVTPAGYVIEWKTKDVVDVEV